MRKCRFCAKDIQDASRVCEHCGRDLTPIPKVPAEIAVTPRPSLALHTSIAPVSLVDVDMPFASMVGFMVKWSFAAIPAIVILAVLGFVVMTAFIALFGVH